MLSLLNWAPYCLKNVIFKSFKILSNKFKESCIQIIHLIRLKQHFDDRVKTLSQTYALNVTHTLFHMNYYTSIKAKHSAVFSTFKETTLC